MKLSLTHTSIPVFFILLLVSVVRVADAGDEEQMTDSFQISDATSVSEAVSEVSSTLEHQGFEVITVINHAAAAASVGLTLPDTQVILFRDIRTDVKLIKRSQTTAIDLQLKILVWNDNGSIRYKYNDSGYLADRHSIPFRDKRLSNIYHTLKQFGDQENGLISVPGSLPVADTVALLTTVLSDAGFRIPVTINFADDGSGKRRGLRDTSLIIFGNPLIGTQLMQNAREVALDLPQKFLVWEDKNGQTWISYNDPAYIAQRAYVQGLETLQGNIANALKNFANQGAAGG